MFADIFSLQQSSAEICERELQMLILQAAEHKRRFDCQEAYEAMTDDDDDDDTLNTKSTCAALTLTSALATRVYWVFLGYFARLWFDFFRVKPSATLCIETV